MRGTWVAALATVSLAAAPVAAQPVRASAPVEQTESLRGTGVAWLFAVVMALGALLIIIDNDDEGAPTSP
jgi:hypothetical protein